MTGFDDLMTNHIEEVKRLILVMNESLKVIVGLIEEDGEENLEIERMKLVGGKHALEKCLKLLERSVVVRSRLSFSSR